MIALSSIYAMYGAFNSKPLSMEELTCAKKGQQSKTCAKLVNRAAYKSFNIKDNACVLCRFSPDFKNSRIKDELTLLRRLIEPSIPFVHSVLIPSDVFTSLYRLSEDYDIGNFPIIPLNLHLYNFLATNDNARYSKDELITHFSHYLHLNDNGVSGFFSDPTELINYVTVYINDIWRIPLESISDAVFNKALASFLEPYQYTPDNITPIATAKVNSTPMLPDTGIKPQQPSNKTETNLDDKLMNRLESAPGESTSNSSVLEQIVECPHYPSEKDTADSLCIDEKAEKENDSNLPSNIKTDAADSVSLSNPIGMADSIECMVDAFSPELIKDKTGQAMVKQIAAETTSKHEDCEDSISNKDKINSFCRYCNDPKQKKRMADCLADNTNYADCNFSNCFYAPAHYEVTGIFSDSIIFSVDTSTTQFMVDMVHSYYVGIEIATKDYRKGLLIHTSYNSRFYFFDLELLGIEPLNFHFSDMEKIFVSFNALEVLGFICKYGMCNAEIHDLQLMYSLLYKTSNATLHQILYKSTNSYNKKNLDYYHYSMGLYRTIYESLYPSIEIDKSLLMEYKRLKRLYGVLSHTYDISDICCCEENGVSRVSYNKFTFAFDWSQKIKKPGHAYRIVFPDNCINMQIDGNSFTMDVCLLFKNLPHFHRIRSRILTIQNNEIVIYYEGKEDDSRRFYDLLMSGIRTAYSRRFDNVLITDSYSVVFNTCT